MRLFSHPRFLAVYSGVLTVVFAATVGLGLRNGGSILHSVHAEENDPEWLRSTRLQYGELMLWSRMERRGW